MEAEVITVMDAEVIPVIHLESDEYNYPNPITFDQEDSFEQISMPNEEDEGFATSFLSDPSVWLIGDLSGKVDIIPIRIINYDEYPVSITDGDFYKDKIVMPQNEVTGKIPLKLFNHTTAGDGKYLMLEVKVIVKKKQGYDPITKTVGKRKLDETEGTITSWFDDILVFYFKKIDIAAVIGKGFEGSAESIKPDYDLSSKRENFVGVSFISSKYTPSASQVKYVFDIKNEMKQSNKVACLKFHYGMKKQIRVGLLVYMKGGKIKDPRSGVNIDIDYSKSKETRDIRRIWLFETAIVITLDWLLDDPGNDQVARGCIMVRLLNENAKQIFKPILRDQEIHFFFFKKDLVKHILGNRKYTRLPVFGFTLENLDDESKLDFTGADLVPKIWWDLLNVSSKFVI
jgi:hypothetical protein